MGRFFTPLPLAGGVGGGFFLPHDPGSSQHRQRQDIGRD